MKTKKILFTALIVMMLTSCVSKSYFQVYKVVPFSKLVVKNNNLVYEDENCRVSYNLWSEGGNIGFQFFNKTDNNIYLNLEESFFILNGISYNYYRKRVFTSSTSSLATSSFGANATKSVTGLNYSNLIQTNRISATNTFGNMTSTGFSVSYNEEKFVCIPSKTSKVISEYSINESLFRDCDLYKYPTKKQVKSKTFSKEQSPLVFSNRIAYSMGQTDNLIKFDNEFYVEEISNYPKSEMFESKYEEYCGQKSETKTKYFKNVSPNKFYIKYNKSKDTWKH
ncbi:MAG: hypothetical protein H3C45_04450 [Bacteroidia bacterium]|nr:hypothetical protein [Bacteroidia bacterium]